MVDIVGGSCCYVARSDTEVVDSVWHWNMLGQLSAGKDEERLATYHDVRVVGVVIHLIVSGDHVLGQTMASVGELQCLMVTVLLPWLGSTLTRRGLVSPSEILESIRKLFKCLLLVKM